MYWTKEKPTRTGSYWYKRETQNASDFLADPTIVFVRNYAGELAVGNSSLRFWGDPRDRWAGPIPIPTEKGGETMAKKLVVVEKMVNLTKELKKVLDDLEEGNKLSADEALQALTYIDEIDLENSGKKVRTELEQARVTLNKIFNADGKEKTPMAKKEEKKTVTLDMIHALLAEIIEKLEKGHFTAPASKPKPAEVIEAKKEEVKEKAAAAAPTGDINSLLAQLTTAKEKKDDDTARKIRQKLRKLGYSLRSK